MIKSYQQQKGAAMLITVVLMLILITLVTLYTSRIISVNNKISLNEQNRILAKEAAEAGLMRAYGLLTEQPRWNGTAISEVLAGAGRFTVSGVRQTLTRQSTDIRLISLTSIGRSPDGLATETLNEQAYQYSLLANTPDAPLIVAGGIAVTGNFEVAANPNGGGQGVPLSIWTDSTVDMNNGSGTTCGKQELLDGQCSTNPYSERGFKDSDILDNDPSFPSDMMEYLFNVPESNWSALREDADVLATSCSGLDETSTGLIWVDGPCFVNSGTQIGTTADPVIVIVTDNDITMNGGSALNGMLFSFRKPSVLTDFEINMNGGAVVNGVVASNHQVGHANGTFNSTFDADVLAQLKENDAFLRVGRVPGSWRDF